MGSELDEAFSSMILSASGWRGIFAESGSEESTFENISQVHWILSAAAARVFLDYISNNDITGAIIVGRDSRPTGENIARAVICSLASCDRKVLYTGIAAAPEIMAYARSASLHGCSGEKISGFVYISASHNPIGHNGIKFCLTDGGVIQAEKNAKLTSAFKSFMSSPERVGEIKTLFTRVEADGVLAGKLSAVYDSEKKYKNGALAAYRGFTNEIISGSAENKKQEDLFSLLRIELKKRPLGIAADFNGSARAASVDRDFFFSLEVPFAAINDKPGKIVHSIVPEGENLEPCRQFLERVNAGDPSFALGYMSDCDGDRGNLVIMDGERGGARILEAQEVFALSCVAELSFLVWKGELKFDDFGNSLSQSAIAVNDPTSLRIDRIAKAFGTSVFRAEVGEANVVSLARKLREQGYIVRILGEGSVGGTIIHPSSVRDPLDTLGAILKLHAIRSGGNYSGMGLFEIWCNLSGQKGIYRCDFTLADIIASLPAFVTTGAVSGDALLKVKTVDHGLLKDRYQKIFLRDWDEKKTCLLEGHGISGWEAIAYNGTQEKRNLSSFGEAGQGGLKIEFLAQDGTKTAFIWMRGSATEPVLRVVADASCADGSARDLEKTLIHWQRRMVLEADDACRQTARRGV